MFHILIEFNVFVKKLKNNYRESYMKKTNFDYLYYHRRYCKWVNPRWGTL